MSRRRQTREFKLSSVCYLHIMYDPGCVCVSLTGLSIQPHDLRVSELQLSAQQEVALQNQAARFTHHRPVLRLH